MGAVGTITNPENKPSEIPKILTDEVDKRPGHDFLSLGNTIARIIKNSDPHYTIGIYGDWGTGKTTLMRLIEKNLNVNSGSDENMTSIVWFNAWRYEREETKATVPLILTILSVLYQKIERKIQYEQDIKQQKRNRLEKFKEQSKKYLREWSLSVTLPIPIVGGELTLNHENKTGSLENVIQKDTNIIKPSLQEGLELIEKLLKEIDVDLENGLKLVVFIDDLDRCSPQNALEVLESIKVFLDIDGVVYIIGLSYNTLDRLISHAYRESGIQGRDYIKKIIQIPIRIPNWDHADIVDLIETKIAKKLTDEYSTLLIENARTISRVVDSNPRQLKRFINSLIIAFETFSKTETTVNVTLRKLFLFQILKSRLNSFYIAFKQDPNFRKILEPIIRRRTYLHKVREGAKPYSIAIKAFFDYLDNPTDQESDKQISKRRELLKEYFKTIEVSGMERIAYSDIISKLDKHDWNLLKKFRDSLFIKNDDLNLYDRATDVVEEVSYEQFIQ